MAAIESSNQSPRPSAEVLHALPSDLSVPALWSEVVAAVQRFSVAAGASPSDVVVLLPSAAHLPLARAGWSMLWLTGWMPRFETTRTLAESLVPRLPGQHPAPCFDTAIDCLQATRMLADAVPEWLGRDPRGFDLAVRRLVDLAQALAEARAACPPPTRSAWAEEARERLAGGGGPAAGERLLARLALEWSLGASTDAADALFAYRPAAGSRCAPAAPMH